MNYYNSEKKKVYTRTLMDNMGLPKDDKILKELNFYPIEYNYPEYDTLLETFTPFDNLFDSGDKYIQNFKVSDLPDSILKNNLEGYKNTRLTEARKAADDSVESYLSEFSEIEKQTWIRQQDEVHAYLEDSNASTPTLDALAEARGIPRETMIEKAIDKIATFEPIKLKIVGKQQAYEDQIKEIYKNEEKSYKERILELREIVFDYNV